MQDNSKYLKIWKPLMDRVVAFVLSIALMPVFLLISLILKLTGDPVFFKHTRPGFQGELFEVFKFTSMRNGEITPFGHFLRKSSLDELPQLINILRGEMSIVGPRPLLIEYEKKYNSQELRRHLLKPGITGLAQINGRNALTLKEKLIFDIEYVDKVGFLLDIKIIIKTAIRVFYFKQADYHTLELDKQ